MLNPVSVSSLGADSAWDLDGTPSSQADTEVCDLELAADIFNRQEDERSDFQRLVSNGRCRNPEQRCTQPRRAEAVVDDYGRFIIQWEQCPKCGYCDDGPE